MLGAALSDVPPAGAREVRSRIVAFLAAADDAAWLEKLQTHLRPMARRAAFELWDPSMVPAGAPWRDAIAEGLARARVVVVLVSASLLADDDFAESRLPELVARATIQASHSTPCPWRRRAGGCSRRPKRSRPP
jgi:hypothetical protein